MRVTFTSECLNCGRTFDDGTMTALTAEGTTSNERTHCIVTYGDQCGCRYKAIRAAGVISNAAGVDHDDPANEERWHAFLASEVCEVIKN